MFVCSVHSSLYFRAMSFEQNAMFRVPKREHMTLTDGGLYTASCRSTNTGGTSNTRERVCILSTEKIIGDADDCRWPEHTWPKTRARFLGFASDGRGFRRNLNLHGGSLHCLCVEKKKITCTRRAWSNDTARLPLPAKCARPTERADFQLEASEIFGGIYRIECSAVQNSSRTD